MILKVRDEQDFNLTMKQNIDCEKGVIELLVTAWDKEAHTTETRVFSAEKFRDALGYYRQKETELFGGTEVHRLEREFWVDTPLGAMHIFAKHESKDVMTDYPGVYVDLVRKGHGAEMLACIEYDSSDGRMLATVYDIGHDEPTVIHHYDLDEEEET